MAPIDFQSEFAQTVYNMAYQRDQRWQEEKKQVEAGLQQAIKDFKGLKAGELDLADLTVTDNGWEFKPKAPAKAAKSD